MLRVVLEERLLVLELLGRSAAPCRWRRSRATPACARRPSRSSRCSDTASSRTSRVVAGSAFAGIHWPSSTFTSTVLIGVPSFSTITVTLWSAPFLVTRATNDFRLRWLMPVSTHFISPLIISPLERAVPVRLELAHVRILLRDDLRQPLHVRRAVPARHDQAQRRALVLGQRLAVQRVGEERRRLAWPARASRWQAAAVLLLDVEVGAAERSRLPCRDRRRRTRSRGALALRPALSSTVFSGTPVQRPLPIRPWIGRRLPEHSKPAIELGVAHLAQVVERQRQRRVDEPADLQAKRRRIDFGMAVMLRGEELILRRERARSVCACRTAAGRARDSG